LSPGLPGCYQRKTPEARPAMRYLILSTLLVLAACGVPLVPFV
jgi:hypothetical protein